MAMSDNPELSVSEDARSPTRVRIVAPDQLVSAALAGALATMPALAVVGAGASADVVLWDGGSIKRPSRSSELRAAAGQPLSASARLPVLALAHDEAHASSLLAAGARGAVSRQASAPRLAAALVALRHGLSVLDVELAGSWLEPAERGPESDSAEPGLSAREREVLALLALGLSNKRIADRLDVSIHTIKFHVNSILAKLGADTRTGAVASAVRRGLLRL